MKHLHKNLYVAGQINADDLHRLKEAGITTIINNRPDHEEPGQLTHADASALAEELGLNYVFLPMANGQPLPANIVSEFKAVLESADGEVLAHCRSGMRSSVIWALGAVGAGDVTVEEAIEKGRAAGIPLHNARGLLQSIGT